MPALETRRSKGWGRLTMPDGSDRLTCDLCRATKQRYAKGGSQIIFCLGRPLMRVCIPCGKEVKRMWAEAGGEV